MKTALEKIIAKAKQLKKSFPNTKWTDLIKKASIELKKSGAIGDFNKNKAEFVEAKKPKKPRKKSTRSANVYAVSRTATGRFKKRGMKRTHAESYSVRIAGVGAVKKPVKTSTHKDTKSHNVKISVMSGVNSKLNELKNLRLKLKEAQIILKKEKDTLQKMYINAHRISPLRYNIKKLETELKSVKKELNKIK